jgi:hypothetical protein
MKNLLLEAMIYDDCHTETIWDDSAVIILIPGRTSNISHES